MFRRTVFVALFALPAAVFADNPATKDLNLVAGPNQTKELNDAVAQADAALFAAIFDRCDIDAAAAHLTDDVEFYHDKWGQTSHSKEQFVKDLRGMCERQKTGSDFKSKRVLDAASLQVFPLNKYGAIEIGYHRFYKVTPGQPDLETEAGRFTHLWKNDNGVWKLARILSYDHKLAE
ncbi:MAG TPA: nuclear transport factor 2 family protein [Tahibacter sp.]|nr:nuclear transport factor 2 family protein [Tahibacter sp.]